MATIRKRENGKYQVIIRKDGEKVSKTFGLKKDALHFAKVTELAIETKQFNLYDRMTFLEAIERYKKERTFKKKSYKRDLNVFNYLFKDFQELLIKPLAEIHSKDLVNWRDKRLEKVSSATVNREWIIISAVFTYAKIQWGLKLPNNPLKEIKKPKKSKSRNRRIAESEIKEIVEALDYDGISIPKTVKQKTAWAFLFAIETACRLGEICKLKQEDIKDDFIVLRETKNGTDRIVPLSKEAKRLLNFRQNFKLNSNQASCIFNLSKPEYLDDIHFHDTRHEALSRMALKIKNPMTLAKISGHKNVNILMNIYYNPKNDDLIGLLD